MMRALMNVWSSESIQACLEGRVATNEDEVNVWAPKEISADFLTMQDAELQQQAQDKGVVTIDSIAEANSKLSARACSLDLSRIMRILFLGHGLLGFYGFPSRPQGLWSAGEDARVPYLVAPVVVPDAAGAAALDEAVA